MTDERSTMTERPDAVDGMWRSLRIRGNRHVRTEEIAAGFTELALAAGLSGDGKVVLEFTTRSDGTQGVDVVGVLGEASVCGDCHGKGRAAFGEMCWTCGGSGQLPYGAEKDSPLYRIVEPS